jgi:hypothetical protein
MFNYNFPSGSVNFKNAKMAVQSIIIPYSWLNVNNEFYNNAKFNIIVPVKIAGVTTTATLNLTIPNGFYTLQNINQFLQAELIKAGYYLVNTSSQNVYYIEFVVNNQLNNVQLNSYVVPTTLPGSWSYGATSTWGAAGVGSLPSTSNLVPQLQTIANNFGDLIGFVKSTTFPASNVSAVTVSTASSFVPQITPVQSLYCGVSLIRNKLANPTNIIANIPLTSAYATNIIYIPQELIWLPVLNGNFTSVQIIFYDQLYNALPIIDTNLTATFLIQYDESDGKGSN